MDPLLKYITPFKPYFGDTDGGRRSNILYCLIRRGVREFVFGGVPFNYIEYRSVNIYNEIIACVFEYNKDWNMHCSKNSYVDYGTILYSYCLGPFKPVLSNIIYSTIYFEHALKKCELELEELGYRFVSEDKMEALKLMM